jgi:hypothetical protein
MAIKMPRCIAIYAGKDYRITSMESIEPWLTPKILRACGPSEAILLPYYQQLVRYQQVARDSIDSDWANASYGHLGQMVGDSVGCFAILLIDVGLWGVWNRINNKNDLVDA